MLSTLQNIGPTEIIIAAVILVILFGGKKIPELAKGIGEAVNIFKEALTGHNGKSK